MLKIQEGFDRFVFFILAFTILIHVGSCLWILVAKFMEDEMKDMNNWIRVNELNDLPNIELYLIAYYYSV